MAGFLEWGSEISSVDRHIKNKFRWEWLNEEDYQGDLFSDYIRKSTEAGEAFCTYCGCYLLYGVAGKVALITHSKKFQMNSDDISVLLLGGGRKSICQTL